MEDHDGEHPRTAGAMAIVVKDGVGSSTLRSKLRANALGGQYSRLGKRATAQARRFGPRHRAAGDFLFCLRLEHLELDSRSLTR